MRNLPLSLHVPCVHVPCFRMKAYEAHNTVAGAASVHSVISKPVSLPPSLTLSLSHTHTHTHTYTCQYNYHTHCEHNHTHKHNNHSHTHTCRYVLSVCSVSETGSSTWP